MIKTTETYATLDRNEPTNLEAILLDSVECLKEKQIAYLFTTEQVNLLQECVENKLNIVEFDGGYAVYDELTNHSRKELKEIGE